MQVPKNLMRLPKKMEALGFLRPGTPNLTLRLLEFQVMD